ncbi:FAD/NAD(P)-binding domain-containing protein [Lentithecium fluviatile CBS 122367]|uniref:FAD/NAD(P)-binding domain-containing protein n=1 Tax=Lentithecium fluviatile CBS 122367 TaxID=1168545 RepID=A0A6G1ITR9_9PLEO|nr:FAD/NAD(P)-binding domain-containing protein [Lentithecium fluviatile CBS 122367]
MVANVIIIVGGGPAGLSAASSIVRQDYKTVLFDSGKYRNGLSKRMHTLPTWDHQDPQAFCEAAVKDFERYRTITRDDGLFEATAGGKTWTGKKVVLATGVEDVFPDIPGYADCWVSGIRWQRRRCPHFARQALRMAKQMHLYTNGDEKLAQNLRAALEAAPAPMTVNSKRITKLVKATERARVTLEFDDGTSVTEAFLAHKPKTKLRGDLAQQLGCDLSPMKTVAVNPPFNQTSVKGAFAAGDCSSPICAGGGAPLQIQAETYKQRALF